MVVSEQAVVAQRAVRDWVRAVDEFEFAAWVVAVRRGVTHLARTVSELRVVR